MEKTYHNLPDFTNLLSDPKFIALLLSVDEAAGKKLQMSGCQLTAGCSGKLDRADYLRKPRGLKIALSVREELRISFCCRECRKRCTPESVMFAYRKVYAFLAIFISLHFRSGKTPELTFRKVRAICGVSEVTVRRWKQWIMNFLQSPQWGLLRAQLSATFDVVMFPRSLLQEWQTTGMSFGDSMVQVLCFLSILSVRMFT